MNLTSLTHNELERLKSKLNMSEDEQMLVDLLSSGKYNDDGIIFVTHMSRNKYYQTKKNLYNKILRIAAE